MNFEVSAYLVQISNFPFCFNGYENFTETAWVQHHQIIMVNTYIIVRFLGQDVNNISQHIAYLGTDFTVKY